ncbi:MAG: HAD-IIB family hydrolase [Pleurocapsa sp.]
MRHIVVTDLDGTLLDHQTYKFTPAQQAIARLQQQEIPLILNSSKTKAEIQAIRNQLQNREPFICENGGVVCFAENTQYLGIPRHEFLDSLRSLKEELQLNYEGFADATLEDVRQWTGLSASDAEKAMNREATEPLLWHDTDVALEKFQQKLAELELQCVRGGRFHHVMGTFNKASCFPYLRQYYAQRWQEEIKIIALGDSHNDLPMLEQADLAVVIPSHQGTKLKLDGDSIIYASQPGTDGWQESMNLIFNRIF